jgi:hypothetical protein
MIIATNASKTVEIGIARTQIRGFYVRTKSPMSQSLQAVDFANAQRIAKIAGINDYLLASL